MEEMRGALSALDDDMGSLGEHTRAFGEHAINSFAFAIAQGQSLGRVFKSLLQDLIALTIRMILLRTIGSIFGGLFGGAGGGGGGAGGPVGNFGGGRAHGGPVWPGQPFLVGERGPELFMPKVPGTIVPNHALGGRAGGAGDQIIQIDARGADFGTVAKISALMSRAHSRELLRMMQDRQLRTA